MKKVGSETVDGRRADHYSGTVKVSEMARMQSKKLERARSSTSSPTSSNSRASRPRRSTSGSTANDLLVKKQETAKGANGDLDSTAYYTDYGTEVSVEAPPACDTLPSRTPCPARAERPVRHRTVRGRPPTADLVLAGAFA